MEPNIKTWLYDILRAIHEIELFTENAHFGFAEFKEDLRTKRAVERNIEIIGEAMGRIFKVQPDLLISNTREIIAMRNRIIHGYDTISDEVIWTVVTVHLPLLKGEVEAILSE